METKSRYEVVSELEKQRRSLIKEKDELKILVAIWKTGRKLLAFREDVTSSNRIGIIHLGVPKSSEVPVEFQNAINDAIKNSRMKYELYDRDGKSWEVAWAEV